MIDADQARSGKCRLFLVIYWCGPTTGHWYMYDNHVIPPLFMAYYRIFNRRSTWDSTIWAGTVYHLEANEFIPPRFCCCSIISFLCRILSTIVIPLSFGHCVICPSNYGFWLHFGIFKFFFQVQYTFYNQKSMLMDKDKYLHSKTVSLCFPEDLIFKSKSRHSLLFLINKSCSYIQNFIPITHYNIWLTTMAVWK